MAAGAYKGLTIRIGADTTKLTSALRGANSVIFKTQSELTKLGKAVKMDPSNLKAASLVMERLGDQSNNVASKIDALRQGIEKLSATPLKDNYGNEIQGTRVDELQASYAAAYAEKAKLAQESYRSAESSLHAMYEELNLVTGATGDLAISSQNANDSMREITSTVERLVANNRMSREEADLYLAQVAKLKQEMSGAEKEAESLNRAMYMGGNGSVELGAQRWLDTYNKVNTELNAIYTKVKQITDGEIDLREVTNSGEWNQAYVDNLRKAHPELREEIEEVMALKERWNEARYNMENFQNAAQLQRLNTDLAVMESKAKEVATAFAEAAAHSNIEKALAPAREKMDLLAKAGETAADRLKRLNEAANIRPNSIAIAAEKSKALSEAFSNARDRAKALKEQIDAYKADGIDKMAASTKDAALAYEQAKEKVASYKTALDMTRQSAGENSVAAQMLGQRLREALTDLDSASAVNELRELEAEYRNVQAEAKSMKASAVAGFGEIGAAAVQAASEIGNLMMQAGQKVVDASNDIDSAYRDMRKTVEGTEGQYQALYDAAMKYSQTHVTSADTMLEMEALAGQVGVTADQLEHFSEVAANLDVATNIDAETIALQMGQIVNVMSDLDPENVHQFADALVNLGNKMPAQESSIMQITQRLSAIGDVANFSTPELLSWAAAIASTGQRSEAAASGISTTITNISKAVGTGGEALQKFAEVAHMSAEDFAALWGDENGGASKALYAFVDGLGDLDDAGFQTLEDLGMSGVRQTQTLMALANTLENVRKAQEVANEGWYDGGQAAEEADKKAEGFSGSLSKMQNSAQVLAATLGSSLQPIIDDVTGILQDLTDYLNGLDDETKRSIVMWGALAAGFTTVYPILSALLSPTLKLMGALRNVAVGGIGYLVNAIKTLSAGGTVSAPLALQDAFLDLSIAGETLGGAFTFLATSGALLPVVFGGIAAVVGGAYLKSIVDSALQAKKFNDTLAAMHDATDDIATDMLIGADDNSTYGRSWSDLKDEVDNYFDSLREHYDTIAGIREETNTSVAMLDHYKQVILDAAGQGDSYTGSQLELETAIEKVNAALGTSYDKAEVLAGVYRDQAGEVHQLADEVNNLVEAKKREIRLSAMEDMYEEVIQAQFEAQRAYDESRAAYNEYIDNFRKNNLGKVWEDVNGGKRIVIDESNYKRFADADVAGRRLIQTMEETGAALREAGEDVEYLEKTYDGLAGEASYLSNTVFGVREGIVMNNESIRDLLSDTFEWGESLEEIQPQAKRFAKAVQDMYVGTDEFAELIRDQPDLFAKMVAESGGSMDKLVASIAEWNGSHLEEKYAILKWDPDGQWFETEEARYEWNNGTWEKHILDVDTSKVEEIPQRVGDAVEEADESAEVEIDATVDTENVGDEVAQATEEASENATVEATMEVNSDGADTSDVTELLGLNGQTVDVVLNVTANTEGYDEVISVLDSLEPVKDVTINVNAPGIAGKAKAISALNDAAKRMGNQKATYTANGNAVKAQASANVDKLNKAGAAMQNESATYTAYGNAANGTAASHVWDLVRAINSMYSKSITLTTYETKVKKTAGESASGAYIPLDKMPRHAAGIFTRPTLTNIGWVGEDGAELYSGNSLVPLTNRKYSMPYINDISDAVARKMGGAGKTTTINLSVTCEGDPNDTADAIVRALNLCDL